MKEIIAGFLILGIFAGIAFTAELKDTLEFPALNGRVIYHHQRHVYEVNGDCNACHGEKTPGKIAGFGKDYAHNACIANCHEKMGGPTKCEECHRK